MKTLLLCSIALLSPIAAAQEAPSFFRPLEYREGLEAAKAEDKILFVQVFAAWDAESKRIRETLWKDEGIVGWLEEKTVPIRVDWDRNKELLREFEVVTFPTVSILVSPEGRELDRVVHSESLEEKVFFEALERIAMGDTPVQTAYVQLAKEPDNPELMVLFADQLLARGRQREGLEYYLAAWDSRKQVDSEFAEFRRTQLISRVIALTSDTLPARTRLEERSGNALERIEAGVSGVADLIGSESSEADAFAELAEQATDYAAIQRAIGRPQMSYQLFDSMIEEPYGDVVREKLASYVLPLLCYDKRYAELLEFVPDPEGLARTAAGEFTKRVDEVKDVAPKNALWRYKKGFASDMTDRILPVFESLVGVGRTEEAGRLADIAIGVYDEVELYVTLIRRAKKADGNALAQSIAERGQAHFEKNYKSTQKLKKALEK